MYFKPYLHLWKSKDLSENKMKSWQFMPKSNRARVRLRLGSNMGCFEIEFISSLYIGPVRIFVPMTYICLCVDHFRMKEFNFRNNLVCRKLKSAGIWWDFVRSMLLFSAEFKQFQLHYMPLWSAVRCVKFECWYHKHIKEFIGRMILKLHFWSDLNFLMKLFLKPGSFVQPNCSFRITLARPVWCNGTQTYRPRRCPAVPLDLSDGSYICYR